MPKRVKKTTLICEVCNKHFQVYPHRLKNNIPRFCTQKCRGISLRGKEPWNKGKHPSLETLKNMSEAQKKLGHTGEKCHNWRGGSWMFWQSEIKKRDHFTCRACHLYDPDIIEVAHKIPIRGLKNRNSSGHPLNNYDNLITLCPNCHARYDRKLISI